ncbi:MAG: GNAT family N-acetyltransferase [Lachnospiraceae bacterium]|nr:GNAT family N-acetyltransferase [Lachnospiraceae bacterium]
MEIIKADIRDADVVGYVHSTAWKQAYADVFAEEYLKEDTPEKRTQEFLQACNDKDIYYYMIREQEKTVGIIKVVVSCDVCEISSFYLLEEYRNKGYGKQVIMLLKTIFNSMKIQLWVLKDNIKARRFYEKNGFKSTGRERYIDRGNYHTQIQYELVREDWAE